MNTKARDYLARLALSRGLYVLLVEDALGLLPTADVCRAGALEPLETFLTLTDLAAQLQTSRSTVQADLRRLEHYGWVRKRRASRLLGHRDGTELHLLADLAAEAATGTRRIVSAEVLNRAAQADEVGPPLLTPRDYRRRAFRS